MSERPREHVAPAWPRIVGGDLLVERGEGAWLHTTDGRSYLDFTSGIGVTNTGHAHPVVVDAIREQAGLLLHGQANIVHHDPLVRLTNRLAGIVPPGLDSFFFANSGAEAVEGAVKLAKQATGRPNVIVFDGSFHGRTHLTMSMTTSKTIYRAGYQPLVPGIFVAPFPHAFRHGWDDEEATERCIDGLERLLRTQTAPEETAAVVVEPILGEGGYIVPPRSFIVELRELCDRYDLLLVVDEVQSGFGRTGRWFACEHFGIVPDVIVMAKGMGSGMPISCVAARPELWEAQKPGSHGGTYGANPVACAAAAATIDVIREEGLLQNARDRGRQLRRGLEEIRERHPAIGDIRGLGLMIATEFTTPDGRTWEEGARAVTERAFEEELLLLRCGTEGNSVRWIPPLIVDDEEVNRALEVFEEAVERLPNPV